MAGWGGQIQRILKLADGETKELRRMSSGKSRQTISARPFRLCQLRRTKVQANKKPNHREERTHYARPIVHTEVRAPRRAGFDRHAHPVSLGRLRAGQAG